MSRQETGRDDLMAEAAALRPRIELRISQAENTPGVSKTPGVFSAVVAGFHSHGGCSVYFGTDPVYHFDADCRLRRAYANGTLYRTQGDTLAAMTRDRRKSATVLRRRDLNGEQLAAFVDDMRNRLRDFAAAIAGGRVEVTRQIPADEPDILSRVLAVLQSVVATESVLAPPIPGKD